MIQASYGEPKKLSCLQSCFLQFEYKPQIVDAIRIIPDRFYSVKDKIWEVPTDSIPVLKQALVGEKWKFTGRAATRKSMLDKTPKFHYEPPKEMKTEMYNFQKEDFNILMNHDKYLLLNSQGLGKSLEMIAVALKRKEVNKIKRCLVIACVASLKFNWVNEIQEHSNATVKVLGGDKNNISSQDKLNHLNNLDDTFFIVTNIETLRNKEILEKLKKLIRKGEIDMVVVDECHKCISGDSIIITNKGEKTIKDIVESGEEHLYTLSFNEKKMCFEYKKIIGRFKNRVIERKMKITYYTKGSKRSIVCTESHKFFIKGFGWKMAKDIKEDDEILDYGDYNVSCFNCGNNTSSYKNMCCSRKCGKLFASSEYPITDKMRTATSRALKTLWMDDDFRKRKSIESSKRMLENNPVYMEGVVEKVKSTRLSRGSYTNNFKYGNGKMSPQEVIANEILAKYGFMFNYVINTRLARVLHPEMRFSNTYKPDFVNFDRMICIEIDGKDHNTKDKIKKDNKKEFCLSLLGYKVIRFTNDDVDSGMFSEEVLKYV